MANYKCVVLLLLIILSSDFLDVEGRSLRKKINRVTKEGRKLVSAHPKKIRIKNVPNSKSPRHLLLGKEESESMEMDVDSFRPTAPGRSPGAGH